MKKPTHIAIIRLSAMGDVAMLVPVIRQFQERYPEVTLTVVTKPFFTKIFKHLNTVSVVAAEVNQEHKGVLGLWKLQKQLKDQGVTVVADMHNVLRSKLLRKFFWLHGIKSAKIDKGRTEKKALTQPENKTFKPLKSTHQRYADVFESLGFPLQLKNLERQKLSLSPETLRRLNLKAQKPLSNATQNLIGIAPFAAHQGKQYPLESMTNVIAQLSEKDNVNILLFGGGVKETETLRNIADTYKNVICIAGQLSFTDELALISNLGLMLSMDSGNGHLAAMFGVPVVTIWGVTHPFAGFVPYGQPEDNQLLPDLENYPKIPTSIYGNKVPKGYEEVMGSIAVDAVVSRIESLL